MSRAAIHLRPFQIGDAAKFEPRLDFRREMQALNWDWSTGVPPGVIAWTVVRFPDQVIGFGGAIESMNAWQAFAFLAHVPRGDWPMLVDCARAGLDQLERRHGAKKITALVRENFPGACHVLERLGFTRSTGATAWAGYRVMARGA